MTGNPSNRAEYKVACSCGAQMSLDARAFGRPRPCRSCGATVTVAWGRDPKSRKTVPVAMSKAPARGGVAAAPAKEPERPYTAFCGCGYSRPVPPSEKNTTPRCPGCGKIMVVENAPPPPPKNKIQKFERLKPSAPLLPLHMRAPLRVKIKAGAQFFDCVCGERLLIRAGSTSRPIQCPACDRFHIVEVQGAPPPGPAPEPGAKPRGAAPAPTRPLTLGEFLCKCGEIQPPRTSRTGKDFTCKKCGRKGYVEMDRDPQTQAVKMRPVFTSEPAPGAEKSAPAGAPPANPGSPAWTCTCGQAIEAHIVLAKSETTCPGCGRKVRLEKWRHPHSTMTMIRPVFGDLAPAPASPKGGKPAPKQAEEVVTFEELEPLEASFSEAAIFEVAAGSSGGDAPPSIEADAQIVDCECGAEILLSQNDVGHTIQCPACADLMTVEEAAGKFVFRMVGAAMDDSDWKLEEFQ
jgi:predicted RNA-binding Zn-ribbon protein involved in translation (DUF1610 family)